MAEKDNHLFLPAGHPSFAQNILGHPGCKCTLVAQIQLSSIKTLKFFSAGLLSINSSPSPYSCLGLPQPTCNALHLALSKLIRFSNAPFSNVSTASLNVVLSANFLSVHSVPLSFVSLIKMSNSICSKMDLWQTPVVIAF